MVLDNSSGSYAGAGYLESVAAEESQHSFVAFVLEVSLCIIRLTR